MGGARTVLAPITTIADQAQALTWAETALEIEPERPERLALQGAALLRGGRAKDAVGALGKSVTKGGDYAPPSVFAWLALAHRQLGHPAEQAQWRSRAEGALKKLDADGPQPSGGRPRPPSKAGSWPGSSEPNCGCCWRSYGRTEPDRRAVNAGRGFCAPDPSTSPPILNTAPRL